jgi:hypothetical protein
LNVICPSFPAVLGYAERRGQEWPSSRQVSAADGYGDLGLWLAFAGAALVSMTCSAKLMVGNGR